MATNKEIDGHVMVRRNSTIGGNAKICGFATVGHDLRVEGWLDAPNIRGAGKGLYASEARLNEVHPHPEDGWWALVGDTLPADLYVAVDGKWVATGKQAGEADIEFEQYVDALQAAQEKAESAEEASTQALRTANANTARIDDVEGDLSTLSTDYTTTKQYLLEAQNDIDILQSQMQAAQGEMSDIREECNNSIVGVTEQTDLKIAELRENAPVLSMAGIVNTIGEVGFSGRYATTYSHYFVNAESKFYYKPYGAEMPIVSPYPYNIAEGSAGNPNVMFALGDTLYRLDEHPSGIENQMIKYIDAEDLDNAEASMRAVVTAVDSKVDDVDTRTRILSEELNGGDIIVNINKEVGIEDGWFELDSAIANVPARYKYRCGLFITFLWQRPADGEKVWRTYQFKGCDSSGEQEEQWQDTSRWNQMADVRFVVENAMSRCSALEDSQREQDAKIAANTAAIDNHEKYLELVDAKKASFINVHAELPDYFGEPGLIGNNIRNVAYTLSMYGDKYATAGIVVKFFAGPGWQVWRYNGGGMTDEANWTQLEEIAVEQVDSIKSSQAEQDEKIAANTAMIENHEQYLELIDKRNASYINVHAELPDAFGEPGLLGYNIRSVANMLYMYGDRYQVPGLIVKFFGMGSWEVWRYNGGQFTNEASWTELEEYTAEEQANIHGTMDKTVQKLELLTLISTGERRHLDAIFTNYDTLDDDMLDFLEDIKPGFKVAWEVYKAWDPNTTNAQGYFEGREDIIFMPPIDVSHVANAAAMFKGCINLKEVGNLCFSSCQRFWSIIKKNGWLPCDIFSNCPSLEVIGDLDISGLVCDEVLLTAPNASGTIINWGYLSGWWRVDCLLANLPSLRKVGKITFPPEVSYIEDGLINNVHNTSFTQMFAWDSKLDLSGRFQELMPPYHCYSLQGYYSGVPGSIGTVHVRTHMAIQLFYCKYDVNGATVTFDDPGQYEMKPGTLQVDEMFAYTNAIAGGISVDMKYATNTWGFIDGSTGFTASDFLNIGTQPSFSINLRSTDWGVIGGDKSLFKYRLTNNLYKNSFNRAAAGYDPCTINLSENSYSALTATEIANITAKGYTLTT